jgi:uncharacterized phage protein (TIGR01671 family)
MREIKFRAWNKDRMVKPFGLLFSNSPQILDGLTSEATLMQYTGLKDKNGKEIYEGDIVRTSKYGRIEIKSVSTDIDEEYGYVDIFPFGTDGQRECGWGSPQKSEIIGNIYEHPELLKEDK